MSCNPMDTPSPYEAEDEALLDAENIHREHSVAGFGKGTIRVDTRTATVRWHDTWIYPPKTRSFPTLEAARAFAMRKLATKAFRAGCVIED